MLRMCFKYLACVALLILSACGGNTIQDVSYETQSTPVYKHMISIGDELRIMVLGEEELSGKYVVDVQGMITFPLIGSIPAADIELPVLEKIIEAKLSNGYLKDPDASIFVENLRPIYILGEVNAPGRYPYASDLTILQAIAMAGGYSHRANKKVFDIIAHKSKEGSEPKEAESSAFLMPGDTIVVRERFF